MMVYITVSISSLYVVTVDFPGLVAHDRPTHINQILQAIVETSCYKLFKILI